MKLLPVLALLLATAAALHAQPPSPLVRGTPPPEVAQFMADGLAAFNKGDYATARTAFEMVNTLDPRNETAIGYRRKIKELEKTAPKTIDQEKLLAGLIVPKVTLKEATLGSVFDYLRTTAAKLSGDKIAVNFVLKLPADVLDTKTVTLNMTNAPYTEVVKYVAELANLNVQYQKFAVLVTPRAAPAPEAPAPPAQ